MVHILTYQLVSPSVYDAVKAHRLLWHLDQVSSLVLNWKGYIERDGTGEEGMIQMNKIQLFLANVSTNFIP